MKYTSTFFLKGKIFFLLSLIISACPTYAIIMIDIDQCKQAFNFYENLYKVTPVNQSIRVVKFDTDSQKIESIDYLLAPNHRSTYTTQLSTCRVEYSFQDTNRPLLMIYPEANFKGIYRSWGKFEGLGEIKSLEPLDKTRPQWQIYFQDTFPEKTLEDIQTHLNKFDHPSQKTKWKQNHKTEINTQLYVNDKSDTQKILDTQKGDIGEIACDLTMMAFGCEKLNAKHTGNQGIDGLYKKGDILIAAEVKYWKSAPTLDSIMREHLISKFNIKNSGALAQIDPLLRQEIRQVNHQEKLYFLPYGVHPDGQAYCSLKQDKFYDPEMEKGLQNKTINTLQTPEKKEFPFLQASPDSSNKEKNDYLENLLDYFMKTTGMSPQNSRETANRILQEREKASFLSPTDEPSINKVLFPVAGTSEISPPIVETIIAGAPLSVQNQDIKLTYSLPDTLKETTNLITETTIAGAPLSLQNQSLKLKYPTTEKLEEYQFLFISLQGKLNCETFESQLADLLGMPVKKTHIKNVRQGNKRITETALKGIHNKFLSSDMRAKIETHFLK